MAPLVNNILTADLLIYCHTYPSQFNNDRLIPTEIEVVGRQLMHYNSNH